LPNLADETTRYRLRVAGLLRAAANDLKRDEVNAAADLGLTLTEYRLLLAGQADLSWELIDRAAKVWPLNERDLLPVRDDAPLGVLIVDVAESAASSRTLRRGGVDYYEYRDTAMSRLATFRPEYIRMLAVVDDDDPANSTVQWNDGHLLYQFTFFVGPVNYYYKSGDRAFCVPMETGDSVWGVPYAPHSFTARDRSQDAYILALTYGGQLVGDSQRELSALGVHAAGSIGLPTGQSSNATGAVLRDLLRARLLTVAEVAASTGLARARVSDLCAGAASPDPAERALLAAATGVSERDLMPRDTRVADGVRIKRRATARQWTLPAAGAAAYRICPLAGDPLHPDTTAAQITVLGEAPDPDLLRTYQHTYFYVLDGAAALLRWEAAGVGHSRLVRPGDSGYAKPGVGLSFGAADGLVRILLLRIGCAVTAEVRYALSGFTDEHLRRYLCEDRQWYRPAGRSANET